MGVGVLTVPVLRTAFAVFANAHAKASIARAWSVWNSFCTFLVTDGVLAGNPMSGVTRPRTAKRTPKPLRGDDTPERLLTALADGARQARDPWPERSAAVPGCRRRGAASGCVSRYAAASPPTSGCRRGCRR